MSVTIPTLGSYTTPSNDSDFNLGEDGSTISMVDNLGNAYNLGKIMDFHPTFKHADVNLQVINYGGREITQTERYGGALEFTIPRSDGTMEALEYLQQQRKRGGLKELYFTITQYINNPDGSSNENMFVRCRVRLTDGGQYKLGQAVEQKIQATFEDFVPVQ